MLGGNGKGAAVRGWAEAVLCCLVLRSVVAAEAAEQYPTNGWREPQPQRVNCCGGRHRVGDDLVVVAWDRGPEILFGHP